MILSFCQQKPSQKNVIFVIGNHMYMWY